MAIPPELERLEADRPPERFTRHQVLFWVFLVVFVAVGIRLHWQGSVIAAGAVLWGLVTHIFGVVLAALLGWVAAFPIAGPIIVKLLTWPLFLLINGAGWAVGRGQPPPDAEARGLVGQGNVGNFEKIYAGKGVGFRDDIIGRYLRLTREGIRRAGDRAPDLVVWPETAFPDVIVPDRLYGGGTGILQNFVRSENVALATGAVGRDAASGKPTNAMFFFGRDGALPEAPYRKVHLLVFGEYVPLSDRFPVVMKWFPWLADFARGPGPEVRTLGGVRYGPQICYEGLFPEFSRGLADRGAQIFVNVTNDSWFGAPAEPFQHLWMTLARGIEFRRPIVRATNTGISAAMRADGTSLGDSPIGEEWHGLFSIPYLRSPAPTFYQRVGYGLVPAVLWLFLAAVLAAVRLGKRG